MLAAMPTLLLAAPALPGSAKPLLSPGYMAPGAGHAELLATLSLTGLANRDTPTLWLNSSAKGWVNGVPVMWPYPQADVTWLAYLKESKSIDFELAEDAQLCTLLKHPTVTAAVKGVVTYDDSKTLNGLKWAAVSAAGIHDGVPATPAMLQKHSCLAKLPVVATIPSASTFATDLDVYAWMIKTLLPLSSTKVLVGACENWANYSTCPSHSSLSGFSK